MAKRVHILQHVPFEGPGSIEPWLQDRNYDITRTRFYESSLLPEPGSIDFLIVMGGPMSVNDAEKFPWIAPEKSFIQKTVQSGKPVLGICLGAQLIAGALGAEIYANDEKEIGWFPVQGIPSARTDLFRFPAEATVFHWHGETFDLPEGAVRLAQSSACRNQAFQVMDSVIGLQFHLETTPESAKEIVSHCRDELKAAGYIQSESDILSAGPDQYESVNRLMAEILSFLVEKSV